MMTNDLTAAKRFLEGMSGGVNPTPVLVAVSGGMDSMCMLHLLTTWGRERNLAVTAAHFNHQLRGAESDRDEIFVRDWCAARDIPFISGRGDVRAYAKEEGRSLEEAARALRYAFLAEQQRELGCTFVLTAHHADDNAETMLLNLLRGTGLRGLSGIPDFRGCIARPFLAVTRTELTAYAKENGIPYMEDATNALDDAARNVLRHKVLPVLRELNPRAVENMTRTAELLARDEETLNRLTERLLAMCRPTDSGLCIDIEFCMEADHAVLSRCIWAMLVRVGGHQKDISFQHIEAVCMLVRTAPGKELSLPYGMSARREADVLTISRNETVLEDGPIRVGQRVAFGRWTVELARQGAGSGIFLPEGAQMTVTRWRPDDRMVMPGSRGARSLKRLCADHGISPAKRDLLPVLRVDGQCAAVPGIGVHCDFQPRSEVEPVYVIFHQGIEERSHEK